MIFFFCFSFMYQNKLKMNLNYKKTKNPKPSMTRRHSIVFLLSMWWRRLLWAFPKKRKIALVVVAKKFLSWLLINKLSLANEILASTTTYIFFSSPVFPWQRKQGSFPLTSRLSKISFSSETFSSISLSPKFFINLSLDISHQSLCLYCSALIAISPSIFINRCLMVIFNLLSPIISLWDPSPFARLQQALFF